jgi:hypothetical protein
MTARPTLSGMRRTGAGDLAKRTAREAAAREAVAAAGPTPRTKATFDIPDALLRELRVAVSELPPKHVPGGLSGLVARGIEAELDRLRRAHNGGQPFESESSEVHAPKGPARRG